MIHIIHTIMTIIVLSLGAIHTPVFSARVDISFPPVAHIATSPDLIITGTAQEVNWLKINQTLVTISDKGTFSHPITLTKPNAYQSVKFTYMSIKGIPRSFSRDIYYRPSSTTRSKSTSSPSAASAASSKSLQAPSIRLDTTIPKQPAVDYLILKGRASNTALITLNGGRVPLGKNGTFMTKVQVQRQSRKLTFDLMSPTGKHGQHTVTIPARYRPKKAVSSTKQSSRSVSRSSTKPAKPVTATPKPVTKPNPIFRALSPTRYYETDQPQFMLWGLVDHAAYVTVNDQRISLNEDGKFQTTVVLDTPKQIKPITITAVSDTNQKATAHLKAKFIPKKGPKPTFTELKPETYLISPTATTYISGRVNHAAQLKLNTVDIPIKPNGDFIIGVTLKKPHKHHYYTLTAASADGQLTRHKLTVLYQPPHLPQPSFRVLTPASPIISSRNQVLITGTSQHVTTINVNQRPVQVASDGSFSIPISLPMNQRQSITLIGYSADGQRTLPHTIQATYRPAPPQITNLTPSSGTAIAHESVRIEGQLINGQSLRINRLPVTLKPDGRFEFGVRLGKPHTPKTFTLTAAGLDGSTLTQPLTLTFEPPKPQFSDLSFSTPTATVQTATPVIRGQLHHTDALSINGESVPINADQTFSFPVTLPDNTPKAFVLKAWSNHKLTTFHTLTLTYVPTQTEVPVPPIASLPTLQITSPKANSVIANQTTTVTGYARSAESVIINGQSVPVTNGSFKTVLSLPHLGKHSITVSAQSPQNTMVTRVRNIYRVPYRDAGEQVSQADLQNRLNRTISLDLVDTDIRQVLRILAKKGSLNIVADKSLKGTVNLSLQAVSLRTAIDLILNTQGLAYKIIDNNLVVAPPQQLNQPTSLDTAIVRLDTMNGSEIHRIMNTYLTKTESVEFMKDDNLLLIQADSKKIPKLLQLAREMDAQQTPQILLEAQVIETASTALKSLGIKWPNSISYGTQTQTTDGVTAVQSAYNLTSILNALEEEGQAKVLARPRIKVVHNEEAEIFIGDEVPYVETTVDSTGRLTESVKFLDLGIKLKVKPIIKPGTREVTLDINPEVSYIFAFRGQNNDVPWIKSRKVQTTVSVQDGNTVIIGGLFNSSDSESVSKLPIIGNLPLLGNLFKSNKTDRSKTELIITVTPQIIDQLVSDNPLN